MKKEQVLTKNNDLIKILIMGESRDEEYMGFYCTIFATFL